MQSPVCNLQSPQLAVYKIRHNPTESDKIRRKLVCARSLIHAREAQRSVSLPSAWIGFDVSLEVAVS